MYLNSLACNYNLDATEIVPCEFPNQFYDCNNVCLNDNDGDGVCDENEISGCQDELACNLMLMQQMMTIHVSILNNIMIVMVFV